jgi:hypothetical protein
VKEMLDAEGKVVGYSPGDKVMVATIIHSVITCDC